MTHTRRWYNDLRRESRMPTGWINWYFHPYRQLCMGYCARCGMHEQHRRVLKRSKRNALAEQMRELRQRGYRKVN